MDDGRGPTPTLRNGNSLRKLFNRLKASPAVYPLEPIAPPDSEFFKIDELRRIRVIRFLSADDEYRVSSDTTAEAELERCSWTEDYWFTRWTRPLKQYCSNCLQTNNSQSVITKLSRHGCSFRRESVRLQRSPSPTECERYIEHLVKKCMVEVLRELAQLGCASGQESEHQRLNIGEDNAAFLQQDNDKRCPLHYPTTDVSVGERVSSRRIVLLYHGIGSGADIWRAVGVAIAARGYRVLAADMLGHGYSSTPDRAHLYTFDSLLADALRLFDHYTTDTDQCILIGHSYGCSLVTAMARARSDRTVQLVLISGGGPTPLCAVPDTTGSGDGSSDGGFAMRLLRAVLMISLLFCGVRRQLFYPARGKHHLPCSSYPVAVPAHVLRYVNDGQNWPQGDAALHRRILVPTLLVHGMLDDHVTLVQECEMERTIPRAFLELLPDTGHMAMLENPEHLTHMILCFMDWWQR